MVKVFQRRTAFAVNTLMTDSNYNATGNIFAKCGYGLPNCTAYAFGRFKELTGEDCGCRGNAGGWIAEAEARSKFTIDYARPRLGAIAVWLNPNTTNSGHVAVVEQILANGDIVTSNSAWKGVLFYMETFKASEGYNWISKKTGKEYDFQGYILPNVDFVEEGHEPLFIHGKERPAIKTTTPFVEKLGDSAYITLVPSSCIEIIHGHNLYNNELWLRAKWLPEDKNGDTNALTGWIKEKDLIRAKM